MLLIDNLKGINSKSGEEMAVEDMGRIRAFLESSEVIQRYDRQNRPRTGKITYGTVDKMTVMLYTELKKTTYSGAIADLRDVGGQERLKALGMPCRDGVYLCPVESTMSDFVNHTWPKLQPELSREMSEAILASEDSGLFFTCDSTPLEASRYSSRCHYNKHYEIRMDKDHIIMVNGHPICSSHTGANDSDYNELISLLGKMEGFNPARVRGFATDGAYHGFTAYADVFVKTGKVMATNQGVDAVFHPEASWKNIVNTYSRFWKRPDFRPVKYVRPEEILRFLINNGKKELVGKFLHNLDFMRGKAIKDQYANDRHICETVHFEAKRWMRFDVRGLHERTAKNRISLRFFFVQILSMIFV